ncbi:hypothetical protein LEP1GSC193_1281 [Leptospira alstonii serovar Pingchang str. 80-412]|uniref:Uncharacterized protein n=2 Tax=Leptospira alstonii TaxID=28452 RepID=M6CG92_9LEPT|nr:hypothetical protein LEP1GSC194_0026 [Leptospira alstonii serovar Sichuan str. 79601]EQA78529.1 hypothetical protein LEP1GSC193_1281 [Leptospira alstonii serovar Pingchang str. 80-412]
MQKNIRKKRNLNVLPISTAASAFLKRSIFLDVFLKAAILFSKAKEKQSDSSFKGRIAQRNIGKTP